MEFDSSALVSEVSGAVAGLSVAVVAAGTCKLLVADTDDAGGTLKSGAMIAAPVFCALSSEYGLRPMAIPPAAAATTMVINTGRRALAEKLPEVA